MATVVGKDPEHIKRVTCRKCASIIEYTLNECTTKVEKDYGGGSESVTYLNCPCCNTKLYVSKY